MKKIINNFISKIKTPKAKSHKLKASCGFTLLFASLIGSLVIAIGMAILNITLKQIVLASAGKESQQAFYSADAGIECALYLDRGGGNPNCALGLFGTPSSTPSRMAVCGIDPVSTPPPARCFGREIVIDRRSLDSLGSKIVNTFELKTDTPAATGSSADNANMCFNVAVLKTSDTNAAKGTTIIESRGYNKCDESSNRFERAIRTVNQ